MASINLINKKGLLFFEPMCPISIATGNYGK